MSITREKNFYNEFIQTNPALVLGLMIISFGLYAINWIYLKNKDFEKIDKFSPEANRGAIILMILPFSWFFIISISEKFIFNPSNLIFSIINIVGWGFILFLILKYLLDFSLSYGRITQTNGLYWFIGFLTSIIGIILFYYKIYWFSLIYLFLFILIPAMQAELNIHYKRFTIKKERHSFYD